MIELTLLQRTPIIMVVAVLFVLIFLFYLLGYSIRQGVIRKNPDESKVDLGAINGTLLGLLGLLLAFTFSMASSRFDTRRELVIEEANDIGTVILRTDFFPDSTRRLLRGSLKEYVEARIAFYQAGMDMKKTVAYYLKADSLSKQTWSILTRYARQDNVTTKTSELVPALNAMIDVTTTRRAAGESTVPDSIMYFLFSLCLCSAFLLGYDNKHKIDWIVVGGFAVMLSATVLAILDLDRPRGGFINMDVPNQKIVELREMFKE
jgi:hypothetical protein